MPPALNRFTICLLYAYCVYCTYYVYYACYIDYTYLLTILAAFVCWVQVKERSKLALNNAYVELTRPATIPSQAASKL